MTMFHKGMAPAHAERNRSGGVRTAASREAAPALFRLLSDSALYRAAMSASRVPLAVLDAGRDELAFVFVNPAFERLSGYAERDALGRPASLALAPCGDESSLRALLAPKGGAASAIAGLRIACRVRRRDSTERLLIAVFDPVPDNRGRIGHWVVALGEPPAAAAEFSRPST